MPNYYWLGLSDERTGDWEWIDGTPYTVLRRFVCYSEIRCRCELRSE